MLFPGFQKISTTKRITGVSHDQVAFFKMFRGTTQVCAR